MSASYRIAIVGSGPAGLSAAGRAAELGISHVLLEKTDHLSDTIYKYQKGKHVMATPSQLVLRSDFDFDAGKREKILGTWDEQAAAKKINVKLKAEVKSIVGSMGDYTITLTNGETLTGGERHPRHRHAGQSQQDALSGHGPAAHPVSARRSRRICGRAYYGGRVG
jgi:heterodisulfide reductase subunit A-like polyferredoxin